VFRDNKYRFRSPANILKEIRALAKNEGGQGAKVKVHIKADTGMGRIGIWHEDALHFVKEVPGKLRIRRKHA